MKLERSSRRRVTSGSGPRGPGADVRRAGNPRLRVELLCGAAVDLSRSLELSLGPLRLVLSGRMVASFPAMTLVGIVADRLGQRRC
jgi:hypothetical protein